MAYEQSSGRKDKSARGEDDRGPRYPKLKRFLLRYDPKGIGLEVENADGEITVTHKNLPPESQVNTPSEVKIIAERVIGEEDSLLSRRRHGNALESLVARLYNIDMPPDEQKDSARRPDDKGGEADRADGDGAVVFHEGQQVVLIELTGKEQVLNGRIGTITKAKPDRERYDVRILPEERVPGGEKDDAVKIKGVNHIVSVVRDARLVVHQTVAIRGLRNHIELNGCLGRIVECHEESHRFEVRSSATNQLFRVKQENLVPVDMAMRTDLLPKENREPNKATTPRKKDGLEQLSSATSPHGDGGDDVFEAGASVQLVGLKTAQQYNGQTAEVLSVDRQRGRYEIRLTDGSVKTIRAENVQLASGKQKHSPRARKR